MPLFSSQVPSLAVQLDGQVEILRFNDLTEISTGTASVANGLLTGATTLETVTIPAVGVKSFVLGFKAVDPSKFSVQVSVDGGSYVATTSGRNYLAATATATLRFKLVQATTGGTVLASNKYPEANETNYGGSSGSRQQFTPTSNYNVGGVQFRIDTDFGSVSNLRVGIASDFVAGTVSTSTPPWLTTVSGAPAYVDFAPVPRGNNVATFASSVNLVAGTQYSFVYTGAATEATSISTTPATTVGLTAVRTLHFGTNFNSSISGYDHWFGLLSAPESFSLNYLGVKLER